MKAADFATSLTETQFEEKVIARAKARGWLVHHDRPAPDPRQGGQFRTVIQGDSGFPDLVLARGRCIIIVELKSEAGRLQDTQREWFTQMVGDGNGRAPTEAIRTADGALRLLVTVWYPSDWPQVCEVLE